MKKIYLLFFIIGTISCSSDETVKNPVSITSVSKLSGEGNSIVTIVGDNFTLNVLDNNLQVFFSGKVARILSINKNSIDVQVPIGASTGNIKIVKNGEETQGPVFEYIAGYDKVSTLKASLFPFLEQDVFDFMELAIDANENIYVTSDVNNQIKKIDKNGIVTLFAGALTAGDHSGPVQLARFESISSIAFDSKGNAYVGDSYYDNIRKITPEGIVTTLDLKYDMQYTRLVFDKEDNMYVGSISQILKVTPQGVVSVLAGSYLSDDIVDGKGENAHFSFIYSMVMDSKGNLLCIDGDDYSVIRKVTSDGTVSTLKTTLIKNGAAEEYLLSNGCDLAVDKNDDVYIADYSYNVNNILKRASDGSISFLIGYDRKEFGYKDGIVDLSLIAGPKVLGFDKQNNLIFVESGKSRETNIRKLSKEVK